MKVVLFCGGLGLRLRDYSADIPKPLVPIGNRPILWHIMKYYAHFGHKDFILCLGYKADDIKSYFLNYELSRVNDFVLTHGNNVQLLHNDISDWRITFVDTGMNSSIGQRLKMVRPFVENEPYFLANYSDTLTDAPLDEQFEDFQSQDKVASMLCVKPHLSLHKVGMNADGSVQGITDLRSDVLVNGGYFMFRQDIFNYIDREEDLVEEPFTRLIAENHLMGRDYPGFWSTMDTFKDKQNLEGLYATRHAPWEVWKNRRAQDQLEEARAHA